jgi:hypothetical protein
MRPRGVRSGQARNRMTYGRFAGCATQYAVSKMLSRVSLRPLPHGRGCDQRPQRAPRQPAASLPTTLLSCLSFALPALARSPFAWKDIGDGRMELREQGNAALVYNYGPQLKAGAPEDRRRCCYATFSRSIRLRVSPCSTISQRIIGTTAAYSGRGRWSRRKGKSTTFG